MSNRESQLWDAYAKCKNNYERGALLGRWLKETDKQMEKILLQDIGFIMRDKNFSKDQKEMTIKILIETIQAIKERK